MRVIRDGLPPSHAALQQHIAGAVAQLVAGVKIPRGNDAALAVPEGLEKPAQGKPPEAVMQCPEPVPNWFLHGVQAALLAPTAMNQQKFRFQLEGSVVRATPGRGFYTKIDLGIAKYHFELGAAPTAFTWG